MFSTLSLAQKSLCEEDSSGSDAGSEVCLEPETDRFGFIVTNGSTAGSVGPPPELVRQREAKWINIIAQWDRMLLKKTGKVKVQCQKGIPASLRAKCWPLLCGATDRMKQNENLYQSLDSQPALQTWVDVIERDLDRQFPFHEMFLTKDGHGQRSLFWVLKAYTQYQPEEGYCQAQGPVAAVLLMNMPVEEAFWCLVQISEQYLPGYYSPLLEGVLFDAAMLTWILKRTCPAAHKHLQHHGVEPLMFATDWLMCLFTRHLPFNTLLRVWDLFFCYGVRVLLQVAVVLVRRVLGRAEQRKQCEGQMETLERLRGIREQVQEEDDSFIAEVCSVPLSDRDLEKQTEKEFEKWRKERPSSTFDPRGRCRGYRMAWARARQSEVEQDRKEREKGNLSIPLARSASTLSLSPSILHRKWRKGAKLKTGEWEGGGRVVRHLSMGAKEDWRGWNEFNLKRVQGVQEEEDMEPKKQTEQKVTGQTGQMEHKQMDNFQNIATEQEEETDAVEEQTEKVETRKSQKEESQLKETEETKIISAQTNDPSKEPEPTEGPGEDQTGENILEPTEHTVHYKQREEVDRQVQVLMVESNDQEIKDENKETEQQEAESEHSPDAEETQKTSAVDTNTEEELDVPQLQVDAVTTPTETSSGSQTDGKVPPVKETQQQETSTDEDSERDAHEGKHQSTESLTETDSHTQTVTETDVLAQTEEEVEEDAAARSTVESEVVQPGSEQHVDSKTEAETCQLCSPECIRATAAADTEAEAEIPVSNDTVRESSEAFVQCSQEECDAVASEPGQEKDEDVLTVNCQTGAEETPTQTQVNEATSDAGALPQKEATSAEGGEANLTAEPDGKMSSAEMNSSEVPPQEEPQILATMGAVEEEEEANSAGEDNVFNSPEHTDTNTNSEPQNKEPHLVKDQEELMNSSVTQASSCSRPFGDFCIRRSSTSHGSRLGRRLSQDLFTKPPKTSQSQSPPDPPGVQDAESKSNPADPTQTRPGVPQTSGVTSPQAEGAAKRTEVKQEPPGPPKRFGLFRRLRGEQPKKTKQPKIQVPKILIQDFSDGKATEKPAEQGEEKVSSRERRRRRREGERKEKEEERLRKKREKEVEKMERERMKPQTKGKSVQAQKEKRSSDEPHSEKTGAQTLRHSASYAETYF